MASTLLLAVPDDAAARRALAASLAARGFAVEEARAADALAAWRAHAHDVVIAPPAAARALIGHGALTIAVGDGALELLERGGDAADSFEPDALAARATALLARKAEARRLEDLVAVCGALPLGPEAFGQLADALARLAPDARVLVARQGTEPLLEGTEPLLEGTEPLLEGSEPPPGDALTDVRAALAGETVSLPNTSDVPGTIANALRRAGVLASFAFPLPGGALALRPLRPEDGSSLQRFGAWAARLATPALTRAATAPPPPHGAAGKPRVLVVEDDADARDVLLELMSESYDAVGAGTVAEGLTLARAPPPISSSST